MASPNTPLLVPTDNSNDQPHVPLGYHLAPAYGRRQEQKRLLNIRRKLQQVHDLREPSATDVPQAREFRLVGNHSLTDQLVQMNSQRHEP